MVSKMPERKPKAKKPKNYTKLSQKQKFIEAAKQAEADESGETFDTTMDRIIPKRTGSTR